MTQLFIKMISRPVVALIGAATVVVLIYAGITVLFSTKTKTLSSPYVWDDCKSTYTIHVESKTGYGQSGKHTTVTMAISGRLHARPLKFSNGYRVVMEFDPVVVVINGQHSRSLESVLQSVFFVDMNLILQVKLDLLQIQFLLFFLVFEFLILLKFSFFEKFQNLAFLNLIQFL